jgi:Zn-dependent protease with chaperone function/uncharacterized RDD family membrane protein YckC
MAPLAIALISLVIPGASVSSFVLLIAAGLVFVSIGRGRLLGSSVRIDGRQLPEIAELTRDLSARLGMPAPQVFVRDDPFVPIAAVGIGEPYALIISSQYYEHLRRGELAFLIARELGHIAAGHTRLTSLLSASGRENPLVAAVFGAWLRRTEYTADRVGLICSDGLDDALGAISITTFHAIGRRVDLHVLAEQQRELAADPALRLGEWTAGVPYATNRLAALRTFDADPLAATWRARLAQKHDVEQEVADDSHDPVARRDCAPLVRRIAAACIDFTVITAIFKTPLVVQVSKAPIANDADMSAFSRAIMHHLPILMGAAGLSVVLAFFIYSAILVGLGGQTLGMTVMELRVVTTRYGRPTIVQSLWRYFVAFFSTLTSVALVGFFTRVHPHDRLSRTRLVRARRTS